MEANYKLSVIAAVHTLRELAKTQNNDLWIKSEDGRRDVLVPHNYRQAFPFWTTNSSWTTEASRASALVKVDHEELAELLAKEDWSFDFPHIVTKEETIRVLSPGKSEDTPDGTMRLVRKELQATSPCMAAKRSFTLLRTCTQIDQGAWVIAEIPQCSSNTYRRLPSGCLIQSVAEDLSKVTWVEHMEVEESMPNQTFYDHLIRSGFAFGAERMVAWLERSYERNSHRDIFNEMLINTPRVEGKEVDPWIWENFNLEDFGWWCMVRGLFENISPNDDCNNTLWRSVTGSEDLKVYTSLYKSYGDLYRCSANCEVAGGVVAFCVKHSPEFVLETLGDERIHHEWDVLGGLRKLYTFRKYSTGGDTRNNISVSMIEGSNDEMLIKQVDVNRSGSLVLWSTVSKKDFDLINDGGRVLEDSVQMSGFSITTDGHTTTANTGGSVITLVLRMLVDGKQPSQEKRQQSIESITFALNQTVDSVKQALEKPRPPSPSRGILGDWQQVGAHDIASEIMQDELGVLKLS